MANVAIYTRSPRIIEQAGAASQETKVELFLFNSPGSAPASPTYTLEKPIPSALITKCTYDIAPFIRKFITHTTFTEVTTPTAATVSEYCYCYVKVYLAGVLQGGGTYTYQYICLDGYGYGSEGRNPAPQLSLMTEGSYYTEEANGNGAMYVIHPLDGSTVQVKYTNLASGLTTTVLLTNELTQVPNVKLGYVADGNKTEIIKDSVVQATYYFYPLCEAKYTPIKCDFVNRSGTWQRLVFFKASRTSLAMKNNEFNLMPADSNYNVKANIRQVFNSNSIKKIKVNTGWVNDDYGAVIDELLLSEKIELGGEPVTISTKMIEKQESINNRNINYALDFKYSIPVLNYIL